MLSLMAKGLSCSGLGVIGFGGFTAQPLSHIAKLPAHPPGKGRAHHVGTAVAGIPASSDPRAGRGARLEVRQGFHRFIQSLVVV